MENNLTLENFEAIVNSLQRPYIIKFGNQSCGPCNTMAPVLKKLQEMNPEFKIFEVDTNSEPELSSYFEIRSVPTIHFCENREILYSFHGVTPYRDLQFVIDNIDDTHFRSYGEFKSKETKKDYTFELIILAIIVFFVGLFVFL